MSSSTPAAPAEPDLERRRRRARLVLVALFALFMAPILIAYALNVLYPGWAPFGTTNRGALVEPARSLSTEGLRPVDGEPLASAPFAERWTLVVVHGPGCGQPCEEALVRMRQTRLALGKDANRLQRWLVVPEAVADPVADPIAAPISASVRELTERHQGVRLLAATQGWTAALGARGATPGTVYLVDPQGYLVLRYDPALADDAVLKDLKRLLRISKIG